MTPGHTRSLAGATLIALAFLLLAPDPRGLAEQPAPALAELLDPALRVPFSAVLLRAPDALLAPGERVLGLRRDGDHGLVAPRDLDGLLRALAGEPAGTRGTLEVQGPRGARSVPARVERPRPAHALAAQWPACLGAAALLLFALACILGGRHPVATPLFAVALCLGVGIGSAVGLVLPGDAGLLGISSARARAGVFAWCALPAALLHLAARFPVVVPSFRRRGLAAVPYALWALPALVAQVRFAEPAAVDAVERVALATSFLAGGVLAAVCAFPGRRLTPVERTRARAALVGFGAAGAGPLLLFVRPHQPTSTESALLALATLALPLALGWAVVRHRLLDPPRWLRGSLVSGATALLALLFAAAATSAAWEAAGRHPGTAPAQAAALALATALAYQGFRSLASRLLAPALFTGAAPERIVVRASRELAGLAAPHAVLDRLRALLNDELRPGDLAVFFAHEPAPSRLARRGLSLWEAAPRDARLIGAPRTEDPAPDAPDFVLPLAPRAASPALVVLAPRRDGLPYAPEERRALEALGRLATLALGDAAASADLEARVASRTAALQQACDDRSAVVEAAARIQAATTAGEVRVAVIAFLERTTGRRAQEGARSMPGVVSLALATEPSRIERLSVDGIAAARGADLEPQVEAVAALAGLALERIHLLAELKQEVERQATEIAARTAGEQRAILARQVAHELRKPAEEIRDLAGARGATLHSGGAPALARIEAVSHELLRRLDCLLARDGPRLDPRPIDLVRLADEALARVARLGGARAVVTRHGCARLPLLADPVRIASLVENLLDNAWKATAAGGRVVLRTAFVRRAQGPCALLEVEDDGPGIPAELGGEIFEPGIGRFRNGFGLGLPLCRQIAAAHGGGIEVESAPGRTVFRVELPQLAERRA